ncbi:MAG: Asp-tRNA(Asn)/Glu-tRNA(Gln) amidotransferase subunit GatA [Desulfuromonadaceae bacterium]|nr:Asp-tRNA(Asn)/Glu-tRNA(Gln) amidotransferase subunit GatA [Desulfuromonadaceae bacterium]
METTGLTIHEMRDLLDTGKISAAELTGSFLRRIHELDTRINAFIRVTKEQAEEAARRADRRIREGNSTLLTGIPLALKDIFVTEGIETTCASNILKGFVPPYDGTVVRRLREQDAVFLGKLNMDEFAMGSSNENSAFGPVRNPWDETRVSGGSSGGSAAAVAACMAAGSLGTDTGGSIRQPASHCGVVGLKPTYGRVSRYGVIAYASSLDQVGPLARDVEDCSLLLQAVAGYDPHDSTSVSLPVPDYRGSLKNGVKGMRIGCPKEYFIDGLDADVIASIRTALDRYRHLGAEIVDITLPHTDYAVACYYVIATAEASSNLARYDGIRFGQRIDDGGGLIEMYRNTRARGFGAEVKRRIMLGTFALSSGYYDAYYLKAQKIRTLIREDFAAAFDQVDAVLTPVAPTPAFLLGEKMDDPLQMYLSDIFTIPVNLAGTCAISLPCGFSAEGLPIGMQLIGKPFAEETILRAAWAFEQEAGIRKGPPL